MKYKQSTVVLLIIISATLISFFFTFPNKDVNSENRTLATFDMVLDPEKGSVVYHDSPVERLDAALSDQYLFRDQVIKHFLTLLNFSENLCHTVLASANDRRDLQYSFQAIGNYIMIEDTGYITEFPSTEPYDQDLVEAHVVQFEEIHQWFSELETYVYFVTQAYDTSWFDSFIGSKTPDHYREIQSTLPDFITDDQLVYEDLNDYMDLHYKTDHHWNHKGARRGYENIYLMVHDDLDLGKIRVPVEENLVSDIYDFKYLGSYGRKLEDLYNGEYDDFAFYEYDLPQRDTAILDPNTLEEKKATIGLYDLYRQGDIKKDIGTDHYITMYGTAVDEDGNRYSDSQYLFIIRNSEGNGKNLLICGDSYARAVRDVLASHFDTTLYLDYRLLARFPIDDLLKTYDIDAILVCSNSSLWNSESYFFTFSEEH